MWPPEPCAQVRILPGRPADRLAIRLLSWPSSPYPPEASSPGSVIPGFLALPASALRGRHRPSDLQHSQHSRLRAHTRPGTQLATRPVQVSAPETTNRKTV